MSHLVARRTREIAIRALLGARLAAVPWMVLGETGRLAVVALAGGIGGAAARIEPVTALREE